MEIYANALKHTSPQSTYFSVDVHCRGSIVKNGFQYGCNFILYEAKSDIHDHGHSLVLVHNPESIQSVEQEITSFVRLASVVHKKAIFAFSDENEVCHRFRKFSLCRFS